MNRSIKSILHQLLMQNPKEKVNKLEMLVDYADY